MAMIAFYLRTRRTFCQPFTVESSIWSCLCNFPKTCGGKNNFSFCPHLSSELAWHCDSKIGSSKKMKRLIPYTSQSMPFQNILPKVWTAQNISECHSVFCCGKSWCKAASASNGSTAATNTGLVCFFSLFAFFGSMELYGRVAVNLSNPRAQVK